MRKRLRVKELFIDQEGKEMHNHEASKRKEKV